MTETGVRPETGPRLLVARRRRPVGGASRDHFRSNVVWLKKASQGLGDPSGGWLIASEWSAP